MTYDMIPIRFRFTQLGFRTRGPVVGYPAKDLVKEVAKTGRKAMSQQSDSHQKKIVD